MNCAPWEALTDRYLQHGVECEIKKSPPGAAVGKLLHSGAYPGAQCSGQCALAQEAC